MKKLEPYLWDTVEALNMPAVDLHAHTSYTDGRDSPTAMVEAALGLGLAAIGFAEHVNAQSTYWPDFFLEIAALRNTYSGLIEILAGIEVRTIDYNGRLDLPRKPLGGVDYVVGVAHRYPRPEGGFYGFEDLSWEEAADLEFRALEGLIRAGTCDVIGHIGGSFQAMFAPRLFPRDLRRKLLAQAHDAGSVIEFNSRHHCDVVGWIEDLKWSEVRIAIGSDSHCRTEVGNVLAVLKRGLA